MSFKILLSDDVHLHKKNFTSLFEVLDTTTNIAYEVLQDGRSLWNRYGDYAGIREIEAIAETLTPLTAAQLMSLSCRIGSNSVNVFKIARAEILSYVMALDKGWYANPVPNDNEAVFAKLFSANNTLLRLNMAAVLHWCSIYSKELFDKGTTKVIIVFSGSQIYQRLLLEYSVSVWARAIVVESFQTGNDFYFEERYTPITEGSDIRYPTIFRSLKLPNDSVAVQNERNKALNKIINGRNKNVTQPQEGDIPRFANAEKPCILLSAQVQNDFSVLESRLEDINALSNYKALINEILETTDFNIAVKTHPWERHKTHLKRPFIFEELSSFLTDKPSDAQKRVYLCENANIKRLLNASDAFVTLTSQSILEACLYGGLRPFTLGLPFYSGHGFTNDFQSVTALVAELSNTKTSWKLTLSQYDEFVDFVTRLLQLHLPSIHKSGLPIIRERIFGRQLVEVGEARTGMKASLEKTTTTATQTPGGPATPNSVAALARRRPLLQRLLSFVVRPFVAKIGNKKDVLEFDANPSAFFSKLRNPWYRRIGALLFPNPKK
jgi:hypothetical protein